MNWEDELYRHHGPLGLPFHFWTCFVAIFGAMTGSFLNVVIHRMPRGESIVRPPSHCPSCNHRIPMWQNLPILSWLMLRGSGTEPILRIYAEAKSMADAQKLLDLGVKITKKV